MQPVADRVHADHHPNPAGPAAVAGAATPATRSLGGGRRAVRHTLLVLLGWPFILWAFAISVVIAACIWLAVNVVYMIQAIAVLITDHSRN